MAKEKFTQVGQAALRSPSGEFLPAVPLFIREEDAGGKGKADGISAGEESLLNNLADAFADIFKYQRQDAAQRAGAGLDDAHPHA